MNPAGFLICCHGENGGAGTDDDLDSVLESCGVSTTKPLDSLVVVSGKLYRLAEFCNSKELSSLNDVGALGSCGLPRSISTRAVGDSGCSSSGTGDEA
jgi:hypothetical protein